MYTGLNIMVRGTRDMKMGSSDKMDEAFALFPGNRLTGKV